MSRPVDDPGIANERTALAWQRTSLSLVAAAAIMTRLTWGSLGLAAAIPLAVALLLSLWTFLESRGRYGHVAGLRDRGLARGGRAPLALGLGTALIAGTELAFLLVA